MIVAAYMATGFAVIQLLVALANLVFRQRPGGEEADFEGLVSILIPARDEEKNIGILLENLVKQNHPAVEIIVFNDQSSDRTEEIVKKAAASDGRISLVNSEGLPPGWLGKNYACHSLALHARGRYFLFLDADVRIRGDIITRTCRYVFRHKLGLLSIFPWQIMKTSGEQMTVPVMNYILLSLLPLVLVHRSNYSSLAAANGQFMLFDAGIYRETMPHEKVKEKKVEDIEIARWFKRLGEKVVCLASEKSIQCRMYNNFHEAVEGFSKNVVTFFGNSFILALLFWSITTLGFIPVLTTWGALGCIFYLMTLLFTRAVISLVSGQNVLMNLIFMLPQQIAMGLFIFKAIIYRFNRQYSWKGRNIS